jgi:hypothetical protein
VFCKDEDIRIESWARDKLAEAFGAWLQEPDVPLEHFVLGERWEQHARTVLHTKIIREAVKVIAIAGVKGDRKFELGSKLVDLYNCRYNTNASSDRRVMHTYYYTKKGRPTVDLEVRVQLIALLKNMKDDIQAARDDIAAAKKGKKTPRK